MAVLETIRTKFGVIITALIAIALLSFIVDPNSLQSACSSNKNVVGKVNGKKVGYFDYKEKEEEISNLFGNPSEDEQQKALQAKVWQYFLDRDLFIPKAQKAGIGSICEEELSDLLVGDNISPALAEYFPGQQPDDIKTAINQIVSAKQTDETGRYAAIWNQMQQDVLFAQYHVKYNTLFMASNLPNDLTTQNFINEANTSSSVRFVMVPYSYQKDTTIKVTDSEIKEYYKKFQKNYKQEATREIEYAIFEIVPSQKDRSKALEEFETLHKEFSDCSDYKKFSKKKYLVNNDYYYKKGELNLINYQINDFVFNSKEKVSSVIIDGDDILAAKVIDTKALPDSVFVRNIFVGDNAQLADSLLDVVKANPAAFDKIAAEHSLDGASSEGTWFTQEALIYYGIKDGLTAGVNKPFRFSSNGVNGVLMVTKTTKPIEKKKIIMLKQSVYPSVETQNDFYSQANSLAAAADGTLEGLRNAAKEQNVFLNTLKINEATDNINGVSHAKEVTRWAFEAEKGSASNIVKVGQSYFVVGLADSHEAGIAKLDEVSSSIENEIYNKKRSEKLCADVASRIEGCTDIVEISEKLQESVSSKDFVSFASLSSQENEPAFTGAVAALEKGVISAPVAGRFGVYVITVDNRETLSTFGESDAKEYANRQNYESATKIVDEMFKLTKGEDNRAHFF